MPSRPEALAELCCNLRADLAALGAGDYDALTQSALRWEELQTCLAGDAPLSAAEVAHLEEARELNASIQILLGAARTELRERAGGLGRVRASLTGYRRTTAAAPRGALGLEV